MQAAIAIPPPAPSRVTTPVTVTVILRQRTTATQYFAATPDPERYGYQSSLLRFGIQQRLPRFDYKLELGQATELFLPTDAISPIASQGNLGLGGTFYAANAPNRSPVALSFRQGFVRLHGHDEADTFRIGRFEFSDGQEITPANATLAWVQANRVAGRLISRSNFADGQRSFDGLDLQVNHGHANLTAMAGRATQGGYNVNANPELNVDLQYLAYTRTFAQGHALVRAFAIDYHDGRTGTTKADNRLIAVRQADHRNLRIGTYGADLIAAVPLRTMTADLLLWGVLQNGQWGAQDHRAGAFVAEAGLRFDHVRTRPWLRGGIVRGTGDNNSKDGVHQTFFQMMPSARTNTRFSFYNMQNSRDTFVEVIDRPTPRLGLRTDLHVLTLNAPTDLWYAGVGPYDSKFFGMSGRTANNHRSLGSLVDVSADYALTKSLTVSANYSHAFGRTVVASIFPAHRDANNGFFEVNYQWSKGLGKKPSAR